MTLAGDQVTNTPARILNITGPARNEMDVTVEDRLPGHYARVHADVESMDRVVSCHHIVAQRMQKFIAGNKFSSGQTEVVLDVSLRYHQYVTLRHRVAVKERKREVVLQNDALIRKITEGAGWRRHSVSSSST